jgi:hypothetical protein
MCIGKFNFGTVKHLTVKRVTKIWSSKLLHITYSFSLKHITIKRGKAVPLQAWSGPEGSRKLWFPNYMTTAQDGRKVVSLTHRPNFPSKYPWFSFLLEAESTRGPCAAGWIMRMAKAG